MDLNFVLWEAIRQLPRGSFPIYVSALEGDEGEEYEVEYMFSRVIGGENQVITLHRRVLTDKEYQLVKTIKA